MNNIRFWIGGAGLALLVLFAAGCDCDDPTDPACSNYCQDETNPDCPNYVVCLDKTETNAAFHIYEVSGVVPVARYWPLYDTDTVITSLVRFVALDSTPETIYEWQIGAGEYTGRSVTLSDFPRGIDIPITLIVRRLVRNTYPDCFPEDDGRDTLTRKMYVVERQADRFFSFGGIYQGIVNESSEIVEIEVWNDSLYPRPTGRYYWGFIKNIPPSPPECLYSGDLGRVSGRATFYGYRQIIGQRQGHYLHEDRSVCGGHLDIIRMWSPAANDSLYIDYNFYPLRADSSGFSVTEPDHYFFRGKRK